MDIEKHYKLEQIKTFNQLRIEEYKDRRAEIDTLLKDTKNIELYALIGVAAYYAWLLTHCVSPSLPWLIPIVIPILGAWRSFENVMQVLKNAKYLRDLEKEIFVFQLKGWERYLAATRHMDEIRNRLGLTSLKWTEAEPV